MAETFNQKSSEVLKSKDKEITTKQMIKNVETAAPIIDWQAYSEKQFSLEIRLPYDCFIAGTLTETNNKHSFYIEMFIVNEKLRGRGIGSNLIKLLINEITKRGVTTLSGHFTSEGAIKALAKIIGEDNLHYSDRYTGKELITPYTEYEANPVDAIVTVDLKEIFKE